MAMIPSPCLNNETNLPRQWRTMDSKVSVAQHHTFSTGADACLEMGFNPKPGFSKILYMSVL